VTIAPVLHARMNEQKIVKNQHTIK